MNTPTRRRGVTMVEVSVAIVLAAILAGMVLEAQVVRGRLHRATQWRELAVVEAGNLMERLTAQSWSDLEPDKLAVVTLSDDFRGAVRDATLHLSVEAATDDPDSRRISLEIDWPGPTGGAVRPVRLTACVHRIEPGPPTGAASDAQSKPESEPKAEPADDGEKKPEAPAKPAGETEKGPGDQP